MYYVEEEKIDLVVYFLIYRAHHSLLFVQKTTVN